VRFLRIGEDNPYPMGQHLSDYLVLAISLLLIVVVATGLDRRLSERFFRRNYYGNIPRSVPRIDGKGVLVRNVKAVRVGRYVILTVVLEKPSEGVVSEVDISDPIGLSALALLEDNETAGEVTS